METIDHSTTGSSSTTTGVFTSLQPPHSSTQTTLILDHQPVPVGEDGALLLDESMEEGSGSGKKRKVFPFHITSELKSLYRSGMVGVGVQYSSLIDTACQKTGLSKAQVKSWIKRTKYHQRKILKQDEERVKMEVYPSHDDDDQLAYHDQSADDDPGHAPLYTTREIPGNSTTSYVTTDHAHQSLVYVDGEAGHEGSLPSLRRHVVMPRETEGGELGSLQRSVDKRSIRVPLIHTTTATSGGGGGGGGSDIVGDRTNRGEVFTRETLRSHVIGGERGGVTTINEGDITYTARLSSPPPHSTHTIPAHAHHMTTVQQQRHPPALLLTTNGMPRGGGVAIASEQQISQEASRIFRKVERNFKKLEELGYQGFAFGIHGEDTQLVYSSAISHCFTPPLLAYLKAIIVAANPPPLIPHSLTTPLITSSSSANHVHLPIPSSTPVIAPPTNTRQQVYMYDQSPARVHQRTAIYELNETNENYEEGAGTITGTSEIEQVRMAGPILGPNGKGVHVVVTCDPNLYAAEMDGDLSD